MSHIPMTAESQVRTMSDRLSVPDTVLGGGIRQYAYNSTGYCEYVLRDIAGNLRASGGDVGGGRRH